MLKIRYGHLDKHFTMLSKSPVRWGGLSIEPVAVGEMVRLERGDGRLVEVVVGKLVDSKWGMHCFEVERIEKCTIPGKEGHQC